MGLLMQRSLPDEELGVQLLSVASRWRNRKKEHPVQQLAAICDK